MCSGLRPTLVGDMEGAEGDAPATVGSGNVVPDTARRVVGQRLGRCSTVTGSAKYRPHLPLKISRDTMLQVSGRNIW